MPIQYGDVEVPDVVLERAKDACTYDEETGHLIFIGAKSGVKSQPQIGFTYRNAQGRKKIKVLSVPKLLYTAQYGYFPYQVRRDRSICKNKMCVNPDHHFAIRTRPEPRSTGNRKQRIIRTYDGSIDVAVRS